MKYPHRARYLAGIVLLLALLISIAVVYQSKRFDLTETAKLDVCNTIVSDTYEQHDGVVELPIRCSFFVNENEDARWSFEINEGINGGKTVTFYDSEGIERQVVDIPTIESFWVEYVNLAHDVNADGYRDLLLARVVDKGNVFSDYLIFNRERNIFEVESSLLNIPNAHFDEKRKIINGEIISDETTLSEIELHYINGYFAKTTAKRTIR